MATKRKAAFVLLGLTWFCIAAVWPRPDAREPREHTELLDEDSPPPSRESLSTSSSFPQTQAKKTAQAIHASPDHPSPTSIPSPTDEFVAELAEEVEETQHALERARIDLAYAMLEQRLKREPPDERRVLEITKVFEQVLDDVALPEDPEIMCSKSVCKVSVAVDGTETSERIETIRLPEGMQRVLRFEGDPSRGRIDRVESYILREDDLHSMLAGDVSGVLTPSNHIHPE